MPRSIRTVLRHSQNQQQHPNSSPTTATNGGSSNHHGETTNLTSSSSTSSLRGGDVSSSSLVQRKSTTVLSSLTSSSSMNTTTNNNANTNNYSNTLAMSANGLSPMFSMQLTKNESSSLMKSKYHSRASAKRTSIFIGGGTKNNTVEQEKVDDEMTRRFDGMTDDTKDNANDQEHVLLADYDKNQHNDHSTKKCDTPEQGGVDKDSNEIVILNRNNSGDSASKSSCHQRTSGAVSSSYSSTNLNHNSFHNSKKSLSSSSLRHSYDTKSKETSPSLLSSVFLKISSSFRNKNNNATSMSSSISIGSTGANGTTSHNKTTTAPTPTVILLPFYLRVVLAFIIFNFVWLIVFSSNAFEGSTTTAKMTSVDELSSTLLLSSSSKISNAKQPPPADGVFPLPELKNPVSSNASSYQIGDMDNLNNNDNQLQQQRAVGSINNDYNASSSASNINNDPIENPGKQLPMILNGKAEEPLHFELIHSDNANSNNNDAGAIKLAVDETLKKLEDVHTNDINNNNPGAMTMTKRQQDTDQEVEHDEVDKQHHEHHSTTAERAAAALLQESHHFLQQQEEVYSDNGNNMNNNNVGDVIINDIHNNNKNNVDIVKSGGDTNSNGMYLRNRWFGENIRQNVDTTTYETKIVPPVSEVFRGTKHKLSDGDDNVLLVIISNRLEGIIPSLASIIQHSSKKVDVVLVGEHEINEMVHKHFGNRINHFTSLTVDEVQEDLQSNGFDPIWTWPEWHSSIREGTHWINENTLHVADWDSLPTHAHELNHLRFYLPYVSTFKNKGYFYFLDDDILVHKDLGPVAADVMQNLLPDKGLVSPCNIWIWNSKCQHFDFHDQSDLILNMPSLYGDRNICEDSFETHCYPKSYVDFVGGALPKNGAKQKAWNFGFSLFALNNWRTLQLTKQYENVMKSSYKLHVFPETSLTFGLGAAYLAFAGAVECWDEKNVVVRDGFGFIEWDRYETTFGKGFYDKIDVVHYTGPEKPWNTNSTVEFQSMQPWLDIMAKENLTIPDQLPTEPSHNLFTLLASDRTGTQWIMDTLDSHPQVCASGETKKPETGFSSDILLPNGLPWYPQCSLKRGCTYAFIKQAVAALIEDIPDKRMKQIPRRCLQDYDPIASGDPYTAHLGRLCNFVERLQGNFSQAAIGRLWVDAFVAEDKSLVGCSCSRGTLAKGLKVQPEWLTYKNFPDENTGPPQLVLDDSKIHGSKVIRLKRRNLWARYKSMVMAKKSGQYHVQSAEEKQLQEISTEKVEISVEDLVWTINHMINIDRFGDEWAMKHASSVLWLEYEDCRDDTPACFKKIFEFLGVDPNYVDAKGKKFESTFADLHFDESLKRIKNPDSVKEALAVNGWGHFVNLESYNQLHLLVYDKEATLSKRHQVPGINTIMYGNVPEAEGYDSRFNSAVPLLRAMPPTTLVVLCDDRDVLINYPIGPDAVRYKAISDFRKTYAELTKYNPNAVVVSAEADCCASALTQARPGDYFDVYSRRTGRACSSGAMNCQWVGDGEASVWQSLMQDLAVRRGSTSAENIYLDGGLLVGTASAVLRIIDTLAMDNSEDERAVLTDFMYRNPDIISLDYEKRMFGKGIVNPGRSHDGRCTSRGDTATLDLRRLAASDSSTSALFIHRPREVTCYTYQKSLIQRYPSWGHEGIQLRPVVEHINRVIKGTDTIVLPPYKNVGDNRQGPELFYVLDGNGISASSTIRNRTVEAIREFRVRPTEALLKLAFRILKRIRTPEERSRWQNLARVLDSGYGFPFWAWYGDYTSCNEDNHYRDSIPLLTPAASTSCGYAFPIPNYMTIIDAQRDSEHWESVLRRFNEKNPWESKSRKVVWRGSISEDNWRDTSVHVRWRLCKAARDSQSDLYDVGLTSLPKHISSEVNVADVGGLVESIAPMLDFMKYRAIIDVDGTSWSPRFGSLLCFNSVIIKIEPMFSEYFFPDLIPWTHYIPVKYDLSDLHENVEWALDPKNELSVKAIILAANKFCSHRLTPASLAFDLLDIWDSYVEMLDREDPTWTDKWNTIKGKLFAPDSIAEMVQV